MKLLVTGGAGFIGSNFIHYMLEEQKDVQILNFDCLSYAGNLANLSQLSSHPRYTFMRGDITSVQDVERCISQGIDAVINFAAETHVDRSILDSTVFVRTNIEGTHLLLEVCRRRKVPRFIQVSTDEVYGSLGKTGKFTEESPLAPNSPYAASKAAADLLIRAYHKTYGMDVMVTRCSNNYGPYQFPEKLLPLMILNALENKPLPVYGDGLHRRDWIHVKDHCRALHCVLREGRPGRVYNIGSDQERQNLEMVQQILALLEKSPELIQFVKDRPGHDRRYAIDATRLRRELSWKPQITLSEGLAQTVRWYQENALWVSQVRNGTYLEYYKKTYENRNQTLKDL